MEFRRVLCRSVVVDDGEVLLERALELPGRRHQRRCRPAVDEEDDGGVAVLAADVDPLVDAADPRLAGFLDAGRGDDALQVADDVPRPGIPGRKSVTWGTGASGREDIGGRRSMKKKRKAPKPKTQAQTTS